jgi:predicted amidohydrolase
METFRIGIAQVRSDIGTDEYDPRPANLERALAAISTLADRGANLIVFGELYLNGYATNEYLHKYICAEDATDSFIAPLVAVAAKREIHVLFGVATHKGTFPGEIYNSAALVGPGGLIGVYSKAHVPAFVFEGKVPSRERMYWSPGKSLGVFDTDLGRIGVEICYDVMFPEVARSLALRGCELIINVSAAVRGFEEFWDHALYVRSSENAIWYLHVSVVGKQADIELFGGSRLFSPYAKVLAEAPRNEEALMIAEVDKHQLIEARGIMHPFENRNPQLYDAIVAPK